MRKILLFTLLLIAFVPVLAKDRSPIEIKSIALQTLQGLSSSQAHRAQSITGDNLKVLHANQALTVVGLEGEGFVIVANDDMFQPVVGFSDGAFAIDKNDGLAWYVETASLCMQAALTDNSVRRSPVVPTTPPIEPLVTSVWNQDTPFNDLVPKNSKTDKKYPCGCVATALGQIMNYHKYPEHGSGYKQYSFKPEDGVGQLLEANFGETTYDWANIIDNYEGNYTEEQGNAVALMILHCGVSVEMNYTPTGSGAYSSEAKTGLIKYFLYNNNLGLFYRDYYSMEAWMDMIFTELNNGRPIYYAGSDSSRGGHAFVFDGYNENGLVHVNWGWGSNGGNGYYDISLLNPPGYSFSRGQDMILGIAKPTEAVEYQSHVVSSEPFEAKLSKIGDNYYVAGISAGNSLWNLCGESWSGHLAIVMENEKHTYVLQDRTVASTANRYNVISNISEPFKAAAKIPADVADGVYHVFVGSKDERDTAWRLVRRSGGNTNSIVIEVKNGEITSNGTTANDTWVPTAISDVRMNDSSSPVRYYDLQGREVDSSTRGLVIVKQGNSVKKVVR